MLEEGDWGGHAPKMGRSATREEGIYRFPNNLLKLNDLVSLESTPFHANRPDTLPYRNHHGTVAGSRYVKLERTSEFREAVSY
jgi:hypothetical protein